MSNSYFQFKQFTISQEKCAMKVCTDACIFGASIETNGADSILDIGTGTGLLSLMMAQRTKAHITAVEIDIGAFEQACENVEKSPWSENISVVHTDIQTFSENNKAKFDLIVSNPPFFENSLKSVNRLKNAAKHSESLSFDELAFSINNLLAENGKCYILLPEYEAVIFEKTMNLHQLFVSSRLIIRQKEQGKVFRIVNQFKRKVEYPPPASEMDIHQLDNSYSNAFKDLLMNYYLGL
ncbi:MAG: tRNA1(Val) (adenine(37)-N6)-methyltransferase [Cytophagales bacterium]